MDHYCDRRPVDVAGHTQYDYVTMKGDCYAQNPIEGRQGEVVGGGRSGDSTTRHGKSQARVLGIADLERLSRVPSFGKLLMSYRVNREICRGAIENHGAVLAFNGSERTLR